MVLHVKRADLVRAINTGEFSVKFNKKYYDLKAKNWEDAMKEGEELLNKLFPNEDIILD